MKLLEKETKVLYRFRCSKCRSKFEMTKQEKEANDWKYTDKKEFKFKSHNPLWEFNCPVCKRDRYVLPKDMQVVHVMSTGIEVIDY